MKCAVHPDVDAVAYCRNCGKALCSVCARPVRDVIYCEDCLAATLGLQSPPPPTLVSPESPAFAPSTTEPYAPGVPMAPGVPVLPASRITNPGVAGMRTKSPASSVDFFLG